MRFDNLRKVSGLAFEPGIGVHFADDNGRMELGKTVALQGGVTGGFGAAGGALVGGDVAGGRGALIGAGLGGLAGAAIGAGLGAPILYLARKGQDNRARQAAVAMAGEKTSGGTMQYVMDRLRAKTSEDDNTLRNAAIAGTIGAGVGAGGAGAAEDAARRAFSTDTFRTGIGDRLENTRYQGALARGGSGVRAAGARAAGGVAGALQPHVPRVADALEERALQRALAQGVEGAGAFAARNRLGLRGAAGAATGLGAAGLAALLSGGGGGGEG